MKAVVCSLVLACITIAYAKQIHFEKTSVRSELFRPLRVNKTFETLKECNYEVHEPYGILEKRFTKKLTREVDICMWKLRAPENHVIHVISITIDLEDETPYIYGEDQDTKVYLYDGTIPGKNTLFWYSTEPEKRYNPFVRSLSSGQDMMINIQHGNVNQELITIKYEFIDLDKLKELLTI